jgi:hypothetical protein
MHVLRSQDLVARAVQVEGPDQTRDDEEYSQFSHDFCSPFELTLFCPRLMMRRR